MNTSLRASRIATLFLLGLGFVACGAADGASEPASRVSDPLNWYEPPAATGCGWIPSNTSLESGRSMYSCNGQNHLAMQTDGNLVLYHGSIAVWATGTRSGFAAIMQSDGNFVLYDVNHNVLAGGNPSEPTGTNGHPGAALAVQDDGNLVVYASQGSWNSLWASNTSTANCGHAGQGCCYAGSAFEGPNGWGPINQTGATRDVCFDGSECSWTTNGNPFSWGWQCYWPNSGENKSCVCSGCTGVTALSVCCGTETLTYDLCPGDWNDAISDGEQTTLLQCTPGACR